MRELLVIFALAFIGLMWLYGRTLHPVALQPMETFANFNARPVPEGEAPELADFTQGLPLSDMLAPAPRLTEFGYGGTAALDQSRELELGGQFTQRTNNYRRTYPDNGSAPLFEFNGAIYRNSTDIGATPPCPGSGVC